MIFEQKAGAVMEYDEHLVGRAVYRAMKPFLPRAGTVFPLTVDFRDPARQPRVLPKTLGCVKGDWLYEGDDAPEKVVTCHFKLVVVEECPNIYAAIDQLLCREDEEVVVPWGSWLPAFKQEFRSDGRGRVLLPAPVWRNPNRDPYFPCLGEDWEIRLRWAGHKVDRADRVLVQVLDEETRRGTTR